MSLHKTNACTTVLINCKGSIMIGYNYDWDSGVGFLISNPRNLQKTAFVTPEALPIKWISKYGSITINQMGREFPIAGINEVGLTITIMHFFESVYPNPDHRPAILDLQWVQYHLDNSSTVDEVASSDSVIRIEAGSFPLHFMIVDAAGNYATFEFIDGKMKIYKNENMPFTVLGNASYSSSLTELKRLNEIDSTRPFEITRNKVTYYSITKAAFEINQIKKDNCNDVNENKIFELLEKIKIPDSSTQTINRTQWSLVFDVKNKTISCLTRNNQAINNISLNNLNFECDKSVMIDITKGFVSYTDLEPYKLLKNKEFVLKYYSTSNHIQQFLIESMLQAVINYPENNHCFFNE